MLYGDLSAEGVFPQPLHGLYRIPRRENTMEPNGVNRLAADFAQVYFPSREFLSLSNNYETGYLDPWRRPSRYAPLIHFLCATTICKLDYGYASFLHVLIQLMLFIFFFVATFKLLGVESNLWMGLMLTTFLLFITPAGLSWLERGQFSLYVAIAYMLLTAGLHKNKIALIIASAFFAYIKWTAFPFLFVVMVVHWLGAKNMKECTRNTTTALLYLLVILAFSLAFRSRFIHFADGLYQQEIHTRPEGVSIIHLLPAQYSKWVPTLLIMVGGIYIRNCKYNLVRLTSFLVGTGIIFFIYPTIAHEYNISSLLCFIPFLFLLMKENPGVASRVVSYSFFLFLLLASYSNLFKPIVDEVDLAAIYLIIAGIFIFMPLIETYGTKYIRRWNTLAGT